MTTQQRSSIDYHAVQPFPERRAQDDPFYDLVYRGHRAAPMVKLDFHVTVRGGLALVKTTRTYVNTESGPLEVIMSLPVPVRAAFFGLSAVIDGQRYDAQVKSKLAARENYEGALDAGKAAVLHEELLRGIHSLSVGNLGAGKEVQVVTRWAELLRFHEGTGELRIPLTVGDVYGVSPLTESVDDLETGGPVPQATLYVEYDGSGVEVIDGQLAQKGEGYFAHIPGNAPIQLRITGVSPADLTGFTEAQQVRLKIFPEEKAQEALDVAILVDRSGSMSASCSYQGSLESQHDAVIRGLRQVQPFLSGDDRLALWEFDTECSRVSKSVAPGQFIEQLSGLGAPRGGTEIGGALEKVCKSEEGRDILLITDGQSYSLDVDHLSRAGNRIFVVLVGEGSLEAMVGHLAVLSGGDLHFSFGSDVGQALAASMQGMRQKRIGTARYDFDEEGAPVRLVKAENNAVLDASWSKRTEDETLRDDFSDAVAAFASSLAFAGAKAEWGARIAEKAGLVTHLTSLVLVAEDGAIQEDLPRTVKQSLPDAQTQVYSAIPSVQAPPNSHLADGRLRMSYPSVGLFSPLGSDDSQRAMFYDMPPALETWDVVKSLGERIEWNTAGPELAQGNLAHLQTDIVATVTDLAESLADLADKLGIDREIFVIALAAYAVRKSSKQAARVYRRLLKNHDKQEFKQCARTLQ